MADNDVGGHVDQGWCSTTGVIAAVGGRSAANVSAGQPLAEVGRLNWVQIKLRDRTFAVRRHDHDPFDCYGRRVASAWVTRWVSAEVQPAGAATAAQA